MASKNTQPFYKNSKDSRAFGDFDKTYNTPNGFVDTPKGDNQYHAHDTILQKNINRLSYNTKNKITIRLILQYLRLFTERHTKQILFLSVMMTGIYCAITFTEIYALKNMQNINPTIVSIASKGILIFMGLIIGMRILRSCLLSRKEKNSISFFHGFMSFAGLHIAMNLVMAIITIINVIMFDYMVASTGILLSSEQRVLGSSIVSIIVISLFSSMLLARFSFLIPEIICSNDDNNPFTASQIAPFLKPLFIILFFTKFVCLNIIFLSDMFLSDITGINGIIATMLVIAPKAIIFVFYHIFVYSLMGVSFKLYNKFG